MEFEIRDLEMLDSSENSTSLTPPQTADKTHASSALTANSLVLKEMHKENEELQNKLKLNYRRLLLFETENNKLVEEKNKFFFEAQSYLQKNQLLTEQNEELEKQHTLAVRNFQLMSEKVASLDAINRTQLSEIRRFSKFHGKIQAVVKPFIIQLKKQIHDLTQQLKQTQIANSNLSSNFHEFIKKAELEMTQNKNEILNLQNEKTGLTRIYEEQIHSFSKEILELQARKEAADQEVARLKKSVEFKNYFENELIRFKRTHEEDQIKLGTLTQRIAELEAKGLAQQQELMELRAESLQLKNIRHDLECQLEATRSQLAKKLDEASILNERMARLEKLNTQLSRELKSE